MIKTIKIPEVRSIIIREPININEPIILDEHIPHPPRPSVAKHNLPTVNYPTALNFTKRIGTVDYVLALTVPIMATVYMLGTIIIPSTEFAYTTALDSAQESTSPFWGLLPTSSI